MSAPINARAMLADRTLIDHAPLYVRWLCERVIELEDEVKRLQQSQAPYVDRDRRDWEYADHIETEQNDAAR